MTPHLVQVESNPDFELAPCFPYLLSLFKSMVMVNEWHFIKLCFFPSLCLRTQRLRRLMRRRHSTAFVQPPRNILVPHGLGHVERRDASTSGGIDVGASTNQCLDGAHAASFNCQMQRRVAFVVPTVQVHTVPYQQLHHFRVAFYAGGMEGGQPVLIGECRDRAPVQERLELLQVAAPCCHQEGFSSL